MTFKYRLSSWVLFALAARMYGADPTRAISGTVLDLSGAAVTKVRITATNTGASLNRETLSAVEGGFIFPLPPVGPYALAMEAPGFRSFEQRGTTVSANVNVTIPVVLQLGETTETVTVESRAALLETRSGRIIELPLNGRNAATLVLLSAGNAAL